MHGADHLHRPYIFRDPVHGDICFARDGFHDLVREIVDEELFQRLRGIKQNGVLNLVFHGAEHSRFSHSLGAAHLAGRMYDAACHNSALVAKPEERKLVTLAALLHDVGHGPFSHLIEEILGKKRFHHEKLTTRILMEDGSPISRRLRATDSELPEKLLPFIDTKQRKPRRWFHTLVSSQLDADRLDYTARDAMMAGILSHRFDRERLIGSIYALTHLPTECVAVDERARDIVESYLHALYHLYRSIYFHHTVRAASWLLNFALRRARQLAEDPAMRERLFPATAEHRDPLWALFEDGSDIPLVDYMRLDEAHVWGLIQRWRTAPDETLRDLCDRLRRRRFFKTIDLETADYARYDELRAKAQALVRERHPDLDPDYYVRVDEPSREGYKPYRWDVNGESGDDSIMLISKHRKPRPIEQDARGVLNLLDANFIVRRLIVPETVRESLSSM